MPKFAIAFILTYASGIIATLFFGTSWGIYLYMLEYFINPASRWWYHYLPDLRYSFTVAIFILIAYLMRRDKYSENRLFDVPQTKWLIINAVVFALVSFGAVWPEIHDATLKTHIKLLIFVFIAFKVINNPSKFERMVWIFLAGNFYLGWVAHSQGRGIFGTRLENFGPSDTGGDGNLTAAILITAVPLLLFYILRGKIWQRGLALVFLAFIMDGIILVNSRGAFLGLIAGGIYMVFFYVIANNRIELKQRLQMTALFAVSVVLFIWLTDVTFWQRQDTLMQQAEEAQRGEGRVFLWLKAVELAKEHPFGVGTWGYQFLSPNFIPEEMLTGGRRAVHSTYFQCLVERGFLGLLFFTCLLFANFRFLRKIKHFLQEKGKYHLYYQCLAIESSFVAFLVAGVFVNRLHAEVLYWFMMFIACFGNIYMLKDKIAETVQSSA